MSGPKKDGELMNCCTPTGSSTFNYQYRFVSDNGQWTGCYDPSGVEGSATCSKDRAGNSLYACFPGSDQIANCRSSCLNGHPQDPNFKLNDSVNGELPIAERGVELYENYGLDTSIRSDSGLYGNDRDVFSCIGDFGRKVSLYGCITFSTNIYSSKTSGYTGMTSAQVGDAKKILLGNPDVYYTITINNSVIGSRYQYFGNNGVVFHYAGRSYPYIIGQIEDLPEVGISKGTDNSGLAYVKYYISSTLLMRRLMNLGGNTITAESLRIVDGDVSKPLTNPYTDSSCQGWNFVTSPSAAAIFPAPWPDYYYFDGSDKSNSAFNCANGATNGLSGRPGCYGSGIKSVYVPPHMEITSYAAYNITYSSDDDLVGSNYGQPVGASLLSKNKTIRTEDSLYFNGVFPAIGSNSLPGGSTAVDTGRNSVFNCAPGTIQSVTVRVRQDDAFYNKYVKPANTKFAPEVFLIPGISNADSFPSQLTPRGVKQRMGNNIQLITNPSLFWSDSNQYWTEGMGVVELNQSFNPGDVLYGPLDHPPAANAKPHNVTFTNDEGEVTCNSSSSTGESYKVEPGLKTKLLKKVASVMAADKAMVDLIGAKINFAATSAARVIGFDVEQPTPGGKYRIKRFDPINGVYSIEWLYVIYYCAMNGRNLVRYDSETKQYETPNCKPSADNTCGLECMLYRDDYTYVNYKTVPESPCDTAMKAYCGMRNLSAVYGTWQELTSVFTNECSCISQQSFCPAQFNSACAMDASNKSRYVYPYMEDCKGAAICNYCSVTVNQVLLSLDSCVSNSDNVANNFGTICGNAECNYIISGDPDDPTVDDTPDNPPDDPPTPPPQGQSGTSFMLIVFVLIMVAILVAVAFIAKKYFIKK